MALLDISVVNLTIPELQTALGTDIDSVSKGSASRGRAQAGQDAGEASLQRILQT